MNDDPSWYGTAKGSVYITEGKAVFNGTDSASTYIKFPKGILGSDTSFSIEVWVAIYNSSGFTNNMSIFNFRKSVPFADGYFNSISLDMFGSELISSIDAYKADLSDVSSKLKTPEQNFKKEIHIVQTFSALNITKLYFNGKFMGQSTFSSFPWSCDEENYLGFSMNKNGDTFGFNGEIDEFRIW